METMHIMVNEGYIDEASEITEKYLKEVSEDLKYNPVFLSMLSDELRFLVSKKRLTDLVPTLDLNISNDGKSFMISGGVRPDPDCVNEELNENKNYRQVKFSIDDNGNMEITRNSGTFFRFDAYKNAVAYNNGPSQEVFNRLNSSETPTVISVYHKHRTVMPDGIEVEESTYSDTCPLSCSYENDSNLISQTNFHEPRSWNYNVMPTAPQFETMPYVFKAYRYGQTLGQVEVQTRYGRENDAKRSYGIYPAGTEYPERLSTYPDPVMRFENNALVVTPDYKERFDGMNTFAIETEMMKSFYRGVNSSRTKDENPRMYEAIEERVRESLEQRYGVDMEELNSGMKR